MAYVSKENRASKAPRLRALAKEYGCKATVAVRNHSTLVLNIQSGSLDFFADYKGSHTVEHGYIDVAPYHYHKYFTGRSLEFLERAFDIMNEGNFDHSDAQSDYFHVGWYVGINIGRWDKKYALAA